MREASRVTQPERDACNLAVDMLHSEIGELLNAHSSKRLYDAWVLTLMAQKDALTRQAEEARA